MRDRRSSEFDFIHYVSFQRRKWKKCAINIDALVGFRESSFFEVREQERGSERMREEKKKNERMSAYVCI